MTITTFYGPPGTGKTTRLLEEIQARMAQGLAPEEIAFVSFSNNAVDEMVARAGLTDKQRPYWRTIHSLGMSTLGLKRGDLDGDGALRTEFLHERGERALAADQHRHGPVASTLALLDRAAALCVSPDALYTPSVGVSRETMHAIHRAWGEKKRAARKLEFADLLTLPLERSGPLPIKLLVLDEAQDTSEAQLRLLRHLAPDECEILIAGDDDQTIYDSLGARGGAGMLSWGGAPVFLTQSHRLPRAVLQAARPVIQRVTERVTKTLRARDAEGYVTQMPRLESWTLPREGSVLILARTHRELSPVYAWLRRRHVNFQDAAGRWLLDSREAEAGRTFMRLQRGGTASPAAAESMLGFTHARGRKIAAEVQSVDRAWLVDMLGESALHQSWVDALPFRGRGLESRRSLNACMASEASRAQRIRVSTIHAAKGSEADHVLLLDHMGERLRQLTGNGRVSDSELRVRYVGLTRARETLTIVRGREPLLL